MFGYNDKLTLTTINTINKKGEIINYNLSFPIDKEELSIPEDVIQMSIFEYHEGREIYGHETSKICVGKTTSIYHIYKSQGQNYVFRDKLFDNIESPDDTLCYYDDSNGKHIVFSKINDEDIVVRNIDELKETLLFISKEFQNINDSSSKIKRYKKEKNK